MFGQFFGKAVVVCQVFFVAYTVNQDDFFELLANFRVFGNAQERGDAGTGTQEVEVFARIQVAGNQSTGRFFTDKDIIADFKVLQAAGQWAVLYFNAEKFQMLFPVGRSHAVCAHQRFAVYHQADHDELAVFKAQRFITGTGESEVSVGPVVYGQDFLGVECCH